MTRRTSILYTLTAVLFTTAVYAEQPAAGKNDESSFSYVLEEGKSAKRHLELQNKFYRPFVFKAFLNVAKLIPLKGVTVLDYGCGTGAASADLVKVIGQSGTYIGFDTSDKQIKVARKKNPSLVFIAGQDTGAAVKDAISSADIVFTRFVVMHQPDPKAFIEKIYRQMKPGAVLVMMEPVNTGEQKEYLIATYPGIQPLTEMKIYLGKKKGLDYNIGEKLKDIFATLGPVNLEEYREDVFVPLPEAKELYLTLFDQIGANLIQHDFYTQQQIDSMIQSVRSLPDDPGQKWQMSTSYTIIGQKPKG